MQRQKACREHAEELQWKVHSPSSIAVSVCVPPSRRNGVSYPALSCKPWMHGRSSDPSHCACRSPNSEPPLLAAPYLQDVATIYAQVTLAHVGQAARAPSNKLPLAAAVNTHV